jgi:SpoVK/Ycf46/Vps4 family AAA+-type ATPase
MNKFGLSRWTRDGVLNFTWSPFESFDKLAFSPQLRDKLLKRVEFFLQGEEEFHSYRLPWRYGIFFFGPSGCGKTAAGRAIAKSLNWHHFTIPAHQILDSHLFERALSDALSKKNRVIVLEDVDQMTRVMDPEVFFTLLDHTMERAEGTFWIANSRRAEDAPKIQLLRPGRFDEAIRLEPPTQELRKELMNQLLGRSSSAVREGASNSEPGSLEKSISDELLAEFVQSTEGLTYSHFEEVRQIIAKMQLEKRQVDEVWSQLRSYIDDQVIAGDRWGGLSDSTQELYTRVKQVDARILMAALDMSDVFRVLIEKVIGDAAEEAKTQQMEGQTP